MESRDVLNHADLTKFFKAIVSFKDQFPKHETLAKSFMGNVIDYLNSLMAQPLSVIKTKVLKTQIKSFEELGAFKNILSEVKMIMIYDDITAKSPLIKELLSTTDIQTFVYNLTKSLHDRSAQIDPNKFKASLTLNELDENIEIEDIRQEILALEQSKPAHDIFLNLAKLYHILIKSYADKKNHILAIHYSQEAINYFSQQLKTTEQNRKAFDFLHQQLGKFNFTISCLLYNDGQYAQCIKPAEKALTHYSQAGDIDEETSMSKKAECINLLIMAYSEAIDAYYQQGQLQLVVKTCDQLFQLYDASKSNPYVNVDHDRAIALLTMWFNVESSVMDHLLAQNDYLPLIKDLQTLFLTANALDADPDLEQEIAEMWSEAVTKCYKYCMATKQFDLAEQMLEDCNACLELSWPELSNNIRLSKVLARYHHGLDLVSNKDLIGARTKFNEAISLLEVLPKTELTIGFMQKLEQEIKKLPTLTRSDIYVQPVSPLNTGATDPDATTEDTVEKQPSIEPKKN